MRLLELFTQPSTADWDWMEDYDSNSRVMNYLIKMPDKRNYVVNVKFLTMGLWTVSFMLKDKVGPGGSAGITGTGNASQVFAAVADCLRDFVSKMQPKALAFTAKQPSRQKLYDVLARKMAAELGWTMKSDETETDGRQYVISAPVSASSTSGDSPNRR